jgi:hypothetical protein
MIAALVLEDSAGALAWRAEPLRWALGRKHDRRIYRLLRSVHSAGLRRAQKLMSFLSVSSAGIRLERKHSAGIGIKAPVSAWLEPRPSRAVPVSRYLRLMRRTPRRMERRLSSFLGSVRNSSFDSPSILSFHTSEDAPTLRETLSSSALRKSKPISYTSALTSGLATPKTWAAGWRMTA